MKVIRLETLAKMGILELEDNTSQDFLCPGWLHWISIIVYLLFFLEE